MTLPAKPPCDFAVTLEITGVELNLFRQPACQLTIEQPSLQSNVSAAAVPSWSSRRLALSASAQHVLLKPADYSTTSTASTPTTTSRSSIWCPTNGLGHWIAENAPLFDCPDKKFEEIYYFRWWTFRKHIRQTPHGLVLTEFITPVGHAGPFNTISCAFGHHLAEGRWLRDQRLLDEYTRFWFRSGAERRAGRALSQIQQLGRRGHLRPLSRDAATASLSSICSTT